MHVIRRNVIRGGEVESTAFLLRHTFRDKEQKVRERTLYLGSASLDDIEERADRILRDVGYTPAQRREILAALRARRDRNEGRPIAVRGKPVEWRNR